MPERIMRWWLMIVRRLAWVGAVAILILSVVPANERPVTGAGQAIEHLTTFGLVAGMFAIGSYRLGLFRILLVAFLFCGGIELLQVTLPTRHARVSDFAVDLLGSYVAIGLVWTAIRTRVKTERGRNNHAWSPWGCL
jgi:VanZ family protein